MILYSMPAISDISAGPLVAVQAGPCSRELECNWEKKEAPISSTIFASFRRGYVALSLLLALGIVGCQQNGESHLYESAEKPNAAAQQEWRTYLGDKGYSHASTLAQIDASNVSQLQEVWRYDAGGAGAGRHDTNAM